MTSMSKTLLMRRYTDLVIYFFFVNLTSSIFRLLTARDSVRFGAATAKRSEDIKLTMTISDLLLFNPEIASSCQFIQLDSAASVALMVLLQ